MDYAQRKRSFDCDLPAHQSKASWNIHIDQIKIYLEHHTQQIHAWSHPTVTDMLWHFIPTDWGYILCSSLLPQAEMRKWMRTMDGYQEQRRITKQSTKSRYKKMSSTSHTWLQNISWGNQNQSKLICWSLASPGSLRSPDGRSLSTEDDSCLSQPAKDVRTGCPDTPSDGFVSHRFDDQSTSFAEPEKAYLPLRMRALL